MLAASQRLVLLRNPCLQAHLRTNACLFSNNQVSRQTHSTSTSFQQTTSLVYASCHADLVVTSWLLVIVSNEQVLQSLHCCVCYYYDYNDQCCSDIIDEYYDLAEGYLFYCWEPSFYLLFLWILLLLLLFWILLLGCIKCIRDCNQWSWACCTNMAQWIEILFGLETRGNQRIQLYSPSLVEREKLHT